MPLAYQWPDTSPPKVSRSEHWRGTLCSLDQIVTGRTDLPTAVLSLRARIDFSSSSKLSVDDSVLISGLYCSTYLSRNLQTQYIYIYSRSFLKFDSKSSLYCNISIVQSCSFLKFLLIISEWTILRNKFISLNMHIFSFLFNILINYTIFFSFITLNPACIQIITIRILFLRILIDCYPWRDTKRLE